MQTESDGRPGPYYLNATALILGPEGAVTPKAMSSTFYAELDAEFNQFKNHVLVQTGNFSEAWPTWEIHPHGDEIVYLLSGVVDFVFWTGDDEQVLRLGKPGSAVVVPKGTWHTVRPLEPASMLFITPGEGTINAEKPGS